MSGHRKVARAVGGKSPSFHSFGLAIDVNYERNPFVARAQQGKGKRPYSEVRDMVQRATALVLGEKIDLWAKAAAGVPAGFIAALTSTSARERHAAALHGRWKRASDALVTYFSFLDKGGKERLVRHLTKQRGLPRDEASRLADGILATIASDLTNPRLRHELRKGRGPVRDPRAGFTDLSERTVKALVAHARLAWGGEYPQGKDMQHFDWRLGTITRNGLDQAKTEVATER